MVWGYQAPLGLDGLQNMPFNRGQGEGPCCVLEAALILFPAGVLYLFFLHLSTLQLQKKQAM